MKTLVIATIFLTLTTLPAFSQSRLLPEDLDKIKLIVIDVVKKETGEVRKELSEVKKELKDEIDSSEKRMKDYVNVKFDALEDKIESVDKRVTHVTNISYGLIALIVVAVGIPQIIAIWQGRRNQELERQIATLIKRIEVLEQQRIVNP